ncbi:MAG: hypothetical protein WDN28_14585 [Chthoniobacter sp.]
MKKNDALKAVFNLEFPPYKTIKPSEERVSFTVTGKPIVEKPAPAPTKR